MTTFSFTKDGRIKPPTPEEYAEADKSSAILSYTHGTTADGRPYYAYVAVKPSKYKEFYAKCAAKETMVLGEYGTVVEGGFLTAPPAEVVERMRALGFDENYEAKLLEEAKRQQAAFLEQQETERIMEIVARLKREGKTTS